MKKKLTAKTKAILALALVLAAVVTIVGALTLATPPGENVVQTILSPFRTAANAIVRQAGRYYNYIFQYEALEADNEALRARVMQMEDEIRTADELQRENERLRQLLNLTKEHEDYELVSDEGPDHDKTFVIRAVVDGKIIGIGSGRTKKQASKNAARAGVEYYRQNVLKTD